MDMTSATQQALVLLRQARTRLYEDRALTIRQADMRARRLNNAIIHLQAVPNPDFEAPLGGSPALRCPSCKALVTTLGPAYIMARKPSRTRKLICPSCAPRGHQPMIQSDADGID